MASPLGWIAAGIGVVIGVVTLCWQKFEGFRMVVLGVWEVIKEFGRTLFDSIVAPFQKILSGIGSVGTAIVQLVKGNFSEAAEAAKQGFKEISQGVVTSNPVSIITRTIQNGDYSTAWEKADRLAGTVGRHPGRINKLRLWYNRLKPPHCNRLPPRWQARTLTSCWLRWRPGRRQAAKQGA